MYIWYMAARVRSCVDQFDFQSSRVPGRIHMVVPAEEAGVPCRGRANALHVLVERPYVSTGAASGWLSVVSLGVAQRQLALAAQGHCSVSRGRPLLVLSPASARLSHHLSSPPDTSSLFWGLLLSTCVLSLPAICRRQDDLASKC